VLLASKVRAGDLNSVYRVRKHTLEIDYLPFSCPILSVETRAKLRGEGEELKARPTMPVTVDLNSNSTNFTIYFRIELC